MRGRAEVGRYFGNYASVHDWQLRVGFVERRPALIVRHPEDPARRPAYFVLLQWSGRNVSSIRDFRHASYAVEAADIVVVE
jgi:RNA polymerase sigma-70 factor (ECF subfamily)